MLQNYIIKISSKYKCSAAKFITTIFGMETIITSNLSSVALYVRLVQDTKHVSAVSVRLSIKCLIQTNFIQALMTTVMLGISLINKRSKNTTATLSEIFSKGYWQQPKI